MRPHVRQSVRDLSKQFVNRFQAVCQNLVDAVFNRAAVSEIGNPDFRSGLPDALDAAFALLKPSRVPRKDVD
jgi:hypothetical protein